MSFPTKSPLQSNPLRLPGQSLDDRIREVIERQINDRIMFAGIIGMLTIFEWARWAFEIKVNPLVSTTAFIIISVAIVPGIVRTRKQVRAMRLGRDGERAVGQTLEQLRRHGYRVFHDILGPSWNIDHVVVGPGGVFTVETKTLSKPFTGRAVIRYGKQTLKKGPFDLSNCLGQARAQAAYVEGWLKDATCQHYAVQPTESRLVRRLERYRRRGLGDGSKDLIKGCGLEMRDFRQSRSRPRYRRCRSRSARRTSRYSPHAAARSYRNVAG